MKKVKFLAMMLAAGMFAACSDALEDSGMDNGGGNNTPATGEGYVRLAINMPTSNGATTKANDDQDATPDGPDIDFEDGVENEYKVTDGIVVFFKDTKGEDGAAPANPDQSATFVSAYSLTGLTMNNDPTEQVTNRVVTISVAPLVDADEQLYALVILNRPDAIVLNSGSDGQASTLTVNGMALTSSSTLAAFNGTDGLVSNTNVTAFTGASNDDFTMANAPLSTMAGTDAASMSGVEAKTLVPVQAYETEEEAMENDAARIYVERVVAKVTLTGFTPTQGTGNDYTYTKKVKAEDGEAYNGDVVQLDGWLLNVTNKSTKLVRDVSGYSTTDWLATATSTATNEIARFAGTEAIPIDYAGANYFRIYWAEDGNYDSATPATDFLTYHTDDADEGNQNAPAENAWNKDTYDKVASDASRTTDHALYCLENTMDYDQMNQDRTTSVLLKTTYKVKFGQAEASAQDFFVCGTSPVKYPAPNSAGAAASTDIVQFVRTEANKILENPGEQIGENDLSLTPGAAGGTYRSLNEIKNLFTLTNESDTKWAAIWSQVGAIKYYKGGVSYYYAALIRHFYDDETDWDAVDDGDNYGVQHLGRYGVVRNNWYEINVQSISGPGDPEIVTPPSEPDDETKGYIRAEINVLSWAKRQQGVDL